MGATARRDGDVHNGLDFAALPLAFFFRLNLKGGSAQWMRQKRYATP